MLEHEYLCFQKLTNYAYTFQEGYVDKHSDW